MQSEARHLRDRLLCTEIRAPRRLCNNYVQISFATPVMLLSYAV